MDGNTKRKKIKQIEILTAATKMFMLYGYKGSSIAKIARLAHASQVTLYKYFPSKIDLAREVVIKLIVDGYDAYDRKLDDPQMTFIEKIHYMMQGSVNVSNNINNDFFKFMLDEFKGKNNDDRVMKKYHELKFDFWKKLLDQGREEQVVSPDISDQGAMLYLDMYVSYVMNPHGAPYKKAVEMKQHEKELVHMFFYGIIGK